MLLFAINNSSFAKNTGSGYILCEKYENKTDEMLNQFLTDKIKQSNLGDEKNSAGQAMIILLIDKDGKILDYKPVQSVSPKADKEALRLAKTLKKFEPATYNGKKVRGRKLITIRFGSAK